MKHRSAWFVLWACLAVSVAADAPVWLRLARGNVVLYCRKNDLKNGERIVSVIEESGPKILADLDFQEPDSLTVFLAGSRSEFDQLTSHAMPEWSMGAADPKRFVLYLQSPRFADPNAPLETVVKHELSHAILGKAVGGARPDRWFEEGFAMMQSGESGWGGTVLLTRGFVFNEAFTLAEIEDVLQFNRDRAALAYEESLAAVKYLVERFGPDAVGELVMSLRNGESMEGSVRAATGISYRQFEDEWFGAMKRKSHSALAVDFTLVLSGAFVVLLVAARIATSVRSRRIKKEWNQSTEPDFEIHETDSPSD